MDTRETSGEYFLNDSQNPTLNRYSDRSSLDRRLALFVIGDSGD